MSTTEQSEARKLLDIAYALHAEFDVGDSEFGMQQNDAPESLIKIIVQLERIVAPTPQIAAQLVSAPRGETDAPASTEEGADAE